MRLIGQFCLFFSVFLLGCALPQDFPITLEIDESFTPDEKRMIVMAAEEWNTKAMPRLKHLRPIFSDNTNTIAPLQSIHDFGRYEHPVFKITVFPFESSIKKCSGNAYGHGVGHFVLLCTARMMQGATAISANENEGDTFNYEEYLETLRRVTIHELGHMLGLMHFTHQKGMMNPHATVFPGLQPADLEAFCAIYECR